MEFIINPEEDDSDPRVILGRSFLRLAHRVVDFDNKVITIYPEPDPFEDNYEKTGKRSDDWDHLLDFNFDDVPKYGKELPPFICKMGKRNRNKKRTMENLNLFYQDIGLSSSVGGHLTQEEAEKETLAVRISQKFALLEEERLVIETMAYNDKYKKIVNEIRKDKVELDGKTMKEEEDAVKRIKEESLKQKMILVHSYFLSGLTSIISKFLILDIPIDRNAPSVVGWGFLYTMAESDSDAEEEYVIKRNSVWKKAVSFLGSLPMPLKQVNWKPNYKGSYTKEEEATGKWRTKIRLTDPYGNIYLQGFTTKKTDQKLSKYHKLSDIMSPNWFIE
nr:hypothetical protein [Tanacetum cinerariifolium]